MIAYLAEPPDWNISLLLNISGLFNKIMEDVLNFGVYYGHTTGVPSVILSDIIYFQRL